MGPPAAQRFHHGEFQVERLVRLRRQRAETISLCVPARDEADTIGAVVAELVALERAGLADEVLVVDDGSTDDTARIAASAGARVVAVEGASPGLAAGGGKGAALWTSVAEADGELIAWVDADITSFDARFAIGLLGPLLTRPEVVFVKGHYDRPLSASGEGGGRVTELVARPLIATLFPHLAGIVQPLSGEYAGRRTALERVPFAEGYGVDIALLVDIADTFGIDAIAQVDLGTRHHRNRPLAELGPQALAIVTTALRRAGTGYGDGPARLERPGLAPVEVAATDLPPLVEVPGYRRRSA